MKLAKFYFTFGNKYRHKEHPGSSRIGVDLHPDGYVTVLAKDRAEARRKFTNVIGLTWAMEYNDPPPVSLFPRGNIATLI